MTFFILFLFPYSSLPAFTGPVVSVLDGDSIEVLHYTQPERVRLSGIADRMSLDRTDFDGKECRSP